MLYRGRVWLSVGRWARENGMSPDTAKRSLQTVGIYTGRRRHRCPISGWEIRRIAGYDVLLRRVNGEHWAYLAKDPEAPWDAPEDTGDKELTLADRLRAELFLEAWQKMQSGGS
jgi:hypothetical protein